MEKYRIIIDTNLWISLLIGKRMSELRSLCNSDMIDVYICDELIEEFIKISSQQKIRKYVTEERVIQTIDLVKASCIFTYIEKNVVSSDLRDAKDLYLLSLAETVNADFILTGDKDLLTLISHYKTEIVTYSTFISKIFK